MGIISTIGRRSLKVRALIAFIYFALVLGAVTMIYPFWLMIIGTTRTGVDGSESSLIPQYLVDDDMLYRKAVEGLFNERNQDMRVAYDIVVPQFLQLPPPDAVRGKFVDAWLEFQEQQHLPHYYYTVGHSEILTSRGSFPLHLRAFKKTMSDLHDGDLGRFNADAGTDFASWNNFRVSESTPFHRRSMPNEDIKFIRDWYAFKELAPYSDRVFPTADGFFKYNYLFSQYSDRIADYNETHGTKHASYADVRLARRLPADAGGAERHDWEFFVRNIINLLWVQVDAGALPAYRDFLRARHGTIEAVNRAHQSAYAGFDEIPLVERVPFRGGVFADWGEFVRGWTDPGDPEGRVYAAPVETLSLRSVEFIFRDWLLERFGSLEKFNAACETDFASIEHVFPPQREYHRREILAHKGQWRREYSLRNFIAVIDYIFLQGRALTNTAIYCTLAVLCALIVNPLAAYALSRFRPPSTYKVLLFLMLTMAFPGTVTQIPSFLMLREAGLLNTFAALILPGLANGYQIFLLKGFFDSLPREVYESAMLDGAGEVRMFWQFTMSLSKPILAVIALGAFTGAYSNFMMALLICQDTSMWTIMPWLYQLQMVSGQGVVFASLIVASLPTFVVFVFAQNVIMRGIVVPVEK